MSKLIKNKKVKNLLKTNKKLSVLFVFLAVILFFLLVVNISDIFSSVITNKNSLFFTQKIELPSYSVYALSVNDFKTYEEAQNFSLSVQQKGGAGVVYESGEKFVFISAYPTLIEAKEIQENLINLGFNARIVNIKIDGISKEYKGSNCEDIIAILNYFRSSFSKLYETTILYDKNEISLTQVNSVLADLLTQLSTIQNKLNKFKQNEDLTLKQIISVPIGKTKSSLEDALYYAKNDLIFTSKLKQIYISFALSNKEVIKKINSIDF